MQDKIKIVSIITFITSLITILSAVYIYIIPKYIKNKFAINMGDAASIGIIGGADGPTSIFIVAGNQFSFATTIIFLIISIIGISYLLFSKKRVK